MPSSMVIRGRSSSAAVSRKSESLVMSYLFGVSCLILFMVTALTPFMVLVDRLLVCKRLCASAAAAAPLPALATFI